MKPKERVGIAKALALVSQIGITMIVCVGIGVLVGNWIDQKAGTKGLFLIICIIISVISAFMNIYKLIMKGVGKK